MGIENITLINTDSITAGAYEVIIGVVASVITLILGYHFIEKKREARRIKIEAQNKRRNILKGRISKHTQMLIETVIKDWYGEQKPLGLKNQQHTIEHLQTGYADTWKLWFECKNLTSCISEDKKIILEYIKNKSSEGSPLYSELEELFESQISQDAMGNITFVNSDEEQIYKLLDDFATKDQLPDNDFKEFIEIIIKDKPLYERFKAVTKNKAYLIEKTSEFEQGLEKIASDFEKWGDELKGTCEDCKARHKELESLK